MLRAKAVAVTIGVTFYRHVKSFNEPAVDPSEGIKTRGPRTNYERGINRATAKTSPELLVTAYVTNLMSLCVSAHNVLGACSEGGRRR